ncbi:hypothetical protein ANCDUO_22629 [Ancylostoma duodenale]|uniref:Uncharacterized protein n=1 Tax=Ancylostoma duodenale TaxID=51022 RepID=A0A0C2CBU2_9BILA|nr:hypothetical protein ANCDUO_22629 [Ancylostoma duodenale]
MSTTRHQRAALFAALLGSYNVDAELLKGLYSLSASKRLRVCHNHFIEAAQFMGAQMMLAGYNFHHFEGVAFGKAVKVVAPGDIPASLLDQLNRFVGDFDGELRLTAEQKDAITKYYTASRWELTTRKEDRRRSDGLKQEVDREMVQMDCEEHSITSKENERGPTAPAFDVEMEVFSNFSPRDTAGSVDDVLDDGVDLREKEPSPLNSFFGLVQGIMLMQLFILCQHCGAKLSPQRVQLAAMGKAPIVRYDCTHCSIGKSGVRKWEGQQRAVQHTHDRSFLGNVIAATSAVTTGTRFIIRFNLELNEIILERKHQELERWAKQLHLAFVSDSFSWKWFLWCKPAIEKVYQQHQQKVLDVVRRKYGGTEGLHIAADGAFDSRGYSGLIERSTRVETLVAMAVKGWVEYFLHNNQSEQEAKNKGCIPLSVWYQKLKTHMWTVIEVGEGERIRQIFNTCLKHVQDVHAWPKVIIAYKNCTGYFTASSPGPNNREVHQMRPPSPRRS